jgi:hypothetical protein
MLVSMDSFELKWYKELSLNERINDKQEQAEHLARVTAYDHLDIEGTEIFIKPLRKYLKYLTTTNAVKPY